MEARVCQAPLLVVKLPVASHRNVPNYQSLKNFTPMTQPDLLASEINSRYVTVYYITDREDKVQGLFPAGTRGNGVPKVILTVGTAFPGTQ